MIIGKIKECVDYQTIDIDLKKIKTKKELLNKVATDLNFPAIRENSWDAFAIGLEFYMNLLIPLMQ